MCGIFGVIRAGVPGQSKAIDAAVVAAFAMLGSRSVARGKDSAGFAAIPLTPPTDLYLPIAGDHAAADTTIDGTRVVRGLGRFEQVYSAKKHARSLREAVVALGHTRAATQGSRTILNASPLLAQTLVGTHNGDITTATIPDNADLKAVPQTDSALLYEALAAAGDDLDAMTVILSSVHGRAALAWADRYYPERVYLARAALSPLVTARDTAGNLWWASVPSWFTDSAETFGFTDITMIPEGTLLVIDRDDNGVPTITDTRTFLPTARSTDESLGQFVWRDFTDEDKAADKATLTHAVVTVPAKKPSYTSYSFGAGHVTHRESVEMAHPTKAMKAAARLSEFDSAALIAAITCPAPAAAASTGGAVTYRTHNPAYTVPRSHPTEGWGNTYYDSLSDDSLTDEDDFEFDADEKDLIAHDEAQEAYLDWVEKGCPSALTDMLAVLKTPADAASIAEELSFTFDESAFVLKELVDCHIEYEALSVDNEFATA